MLLGKKHKCEPKWTTLLPMDLFVMYLTATKWLWNPHVKKLDKNTMRMSVHKFIEQMKKNDRKNQTKTIILEKWLTMTSNWRCYKHPLVAPPNLGVNLTSLKHLNHYFTFIKSYYTKLMKIKCSTRTFLNWMTNVWVIKK